MKRAAIAWTTGFAMFGGVVLGASGAGAARTWSPEDQVAAVQLSGSGEVVGVRYQDSDEFNAVDNQVAPNDVAGLGFHTRNIGLVVYFVESDNMLLIGGHHPPVWCRPVFKPVGEVDGLIVFDFDTRDDSAEIVYPDGQVVTIHDGGDSIDFGEGPPLLNFDFRREHSRGVDFKGIRRYTLIEFIDPGTEEIVKWSAVAEILPEWR